MLVRSRGSEVHFWMPGEAWDVEVYTSAIDPWRVATAPCADVSSCAALVLTFLVLELETKLLITSLESKLRFTLLHQF